MFLEGERMGARVFFMLKSSKMVVETQFFSWWELLPNMPGMQSLKALLLFVINKLLLKGAVRVFAATTPSLILCPHPLAIRPSARGL